MAVDFTASVNLLVYIGWCAA